MMEKKTTLFSCIRKQKKKKRDIYDLPIRSFEI